MERPIILNTEMVKAVLEGRKTQTRRVMDFPKSYMWNHEWFKKNYTFDKMFFDDIKNRNVAIFTDGEYTEWFKCPFGKVGNRLWVRETFQLSKGDMAPTLEEELTKTPHIRYYASDVPKYRDFDKWRPSIHMPREFSRITLEITDIRVERLQDISQEDREAEGYPEGKYGSYSFNWFVGLWNSIHKKENTWQDNPWVWVINFKKLKHRR